MQAPCLPIPPIFRRTAARLVTLLLLLTTAWAGAQTPAHNDGLGRNAAPDVVVIVSPQPGFVVGVGLAYRKQVAHKTVQADVARLLTLTGWRLAGPVQIGDASTNPKDLAHCPVTTAAQLTLTQAPQVSSDAPVVLPYIRAFQAYNQMELVFALDDLPTYRGVTHIDNAALYLDLVRDQGVYRYLVAIRDHQAALTGLTETPLASTAPVVETRPTPTAPPASGSRTLALALLGLGTLILLSLFVYSMLQRRNPGRVSPDLTVQR